MIFARNSLSVLLASTLSALVLLGCTSETKVRASGEGEYDTYQPLPAPDEEIYGELQSVNVAIETVVVRTDQGARQRFRCNAETIVKDAAGDRLNREQRIDERTIRQLAGRQGAYVSVRWKQQGPEKLATSITLTEHPRARR